MLGVDNEVFTSTIKIKRKQTSANNVKTEVIQSNDPELPKARSPWCAMIRVLEHKRSMHGQPGLYNCNRNRKHSS